MEKTTQLKDIEQRRLTRKSRKEGDT